MKFSQISLLVQNSYFVEQLSLAVPDGGLSVQFLSFHTDEKLEQRQINQNEVGDLVSLLEFTNFFFSTWSCKISCIASKWMVVYLFLYISIGL